MKSVIASKAIALTALFLASSVAPLMAAKPMDVIELSNGYPSGPHYKPQYPRQKVGLPL